jgi:flagellin
MVDQINGAGKGVTASLVAGSNGWESVKLTANTEGTAGNITATSGTSVTDTTTTAALSYTATSAYSTGLSSSGSNKVFDSTAGQSTGAAATFAANEKAGSGIATISYSDGAGVSLSATDLTNQTNAQEALTSLNQAITAVAAQDGYIGAQINTLNAVSQVLSTQQENVQAAQNAVQATDYASATSNMSKYEILSQTGIAALAQANTVQQEVLKLLQ